MSKKENLLEDAVLQIKNLEESLKRNAKGILASTMKEEIKSLVKESLKEQEDEEIEDEEAEIEMDDESMDMDDEEMSDDSEEIEMDDESMDMDDEELDLELDDTMGDEEDMAVDMRGLSDEELLKVFRKMKDSDGITVEKDDDMLHLTDTENDAEYLVQLGEEYDLEDELMEFDEADVDSMFDELDEEETIYELELDDEELFESKKNFKAKGTGMGSASKYKMSKKPNMDGGFKTVKKNANKTMGTGKAKFEYKEGENLDGDFKVKPKKVEAKEASRTYGNGSKFRKGGLPKPRAHSKVNNAINEELTQLKSKNDEYRKALDVFRSKLNEVAVFNSNLAYATRLFTEHSTTKQEKLNILKRFDNVETMKESQSLYKTIKNELTEGSAKENTITESIERTVNKQVSTGSVNLIESKTYENPQFLRMKDLMTKIK